MEWLPDNWWEILLRLGLALLFSGIIGAERARTNPDAGLRPHILVCLGSAGIMIMSEQLHLQFDADVARIGAQVVSGIGFLGAGCILVGGNRIRGLTTAAGLWATACIGLCLGIGYYFVSIAMAFIIVLSMICLHPLSLRFQRKAAGGTHTIKIQSDDREAITKLVSLLLEQEYSVSEVSYDGNVCTIKTGDCLKEELDRLLLKMLDHKQIQSIEVIK